MDKKIESILNEVKVGDVSLLDFLTATDIFCDFLGGFAKSMSKEKDDERKLTASSMVCGALIQIGEAKALFDRYINETYHPSPAEIKESQAKAFLNSIPKSKNNKAIKS